MLENGQWSICLHVGKTFAVMQLLTVVKCVHATVTMLTMVTKLTPLS